MPPRHNLLIYILILRKCGNYITIKPGCIFFFFSRTILLIRTRTNNTEQIVAGSWCPVQDPSGGYPHLSCRTCSSPISWPAEKWPLWNCAGPSKSIENRLEEGLIIPAGEMHLFVIAHPGTSFTSLTKAEGKSSKIKPHFQAKLLYSGSCLLLPRANLVLTFRRKGSG